MNKNSHNHWLIVDNDVILPQIFEQITPSVPLHHFKFYQYIVLLETYSIYET